MSTHACLAPIYVQFSIVFLRPLVLTGQQTQVRPTVGLVLSDGAAKGMAQIGVLKVLEETGIEPDIITGTSGLSSVNLWVEWERMLRLIKADVPAHSSAT